MRIAAWVLGVAGGLAGTAAVALAGPLNKAWVPKDAKWVVHVDVETAMGSTVGKCVVEHQKDLDLEPLNQFNKYTGLDAFKDIKGITLYSQSIEADGGVVVAVGTAKIEECVNRLAAQDKTMHKVVEKDGRVVYRWSERGVEKFGSLRTVGESDRMLIVCGTQPELDLAIAVVEGKTDTAEKIAEGSLAVKPRTGSMVFVAVRGLDESGTGAATKGPKMLRTAREFNADIGEDSEGMYGDMKLKAATAKDAKTTADYLQGMLAFGKMIVGGDPETKQLSEMMDSVSFAAHENELTAKFRVKREQLTALVEEVKAERMKGPAVVPVSDKKAPENPKK